MTQQNFRVRKGLTLEGSTSGEVNLAAPAVAGTQSYTLPTALPVSNGYVLASQTDGTMSWVANGSAATTYTIDATSTTGGANFNLQGSDSTTDTIKFASGTNITVSRTDANTITIDGTDTNTTYTIASASTTGGANLTLTGSDSSTDSVAYKGSGATTVTSTDANTITISSTDTNTTYTQNFSSTTGGTNLNLVGSDSTTDTVKFANGTGVTVSYTDADTATIAIGQSVATTASPTFAALTLNGSSSGSVTLSPGTTPAVQTYTLPSAYPASSGYVLASTTGGTLSWAANPQGDVVGPSSATNNAVVRFDTTTGKLIKNSTVTIADTTGNIVTNGDIDIQGGDITNTTGALQIATASNGAITLAPNGTGNVALTLANGGNLTNTRNYVFGNIRQATNQTNGDIYGFGYAGTTNPYRGISLDNYATATTTTGKRTGIVLRNYGSPPRNSIVGEIARGTNPSVPLAPVGGIPIIEFTSNGYNGNNTTTPGFLTFTSTGSTISGTTLTIGTVTAGTVAVGQFISGGTIQVGTYIVSNISGSGSGSTWTVNTSQTVASAAISGGGDGWTSSIGSQTTGNFRITTAENWSATNTGTIMQVALSPTGAFAGQTLNLVTIGSTGTAIYGDNPTYLSLPAPYGSGVAQLDIFEAQSTFSNNLLVKGSNVSDSFIVSNQTSSFASTGSTISGTTLTIGTLTSGTIAVGQEIRGTDFITNGKQISPKTYITANISGSGSGSTWTVNSSQTVASTPINGYKRNMIIGDALSSINATNINFNTAGGSTGIVGNNIGYNRVYGQWQYNTTITPAAANTAYVFPLGTQDFANIASVGSTSRLIPGAAGYYNFQFSVQCNNTSNSAYDAYIWLRKNGSDVAGSMGRVSVPQQHAGTDGKIISGWNYIVDPANATDYFELAYAIENTAVTFTSFGSTSFGPSTATLITTLTPVGA